MHADSASVVQKGKRLVLMRSSSWLVTLKFDAVTKVVDSLLNILCIKNYLLPHSAYVRWQGFSRVSFYALTDHCAPVQHTLLLVLAKLT